MWRLPVVVDSIIPYYYVSAIGFLFFVSDGANKLAVCDIFVVLLRDVLFSDEKNSVALK